MAVYDHDPSVLQSINAAMENLVWLISGNKEQALLILHQMVQGK